MRAIWSVATAFLLLSHWVAAECPNGCSGNGDCMAKDMCNCYKNFLGNDCADRTCPYGYAHVDTPKGDINMDQSRVTPSWILTNSQQHPEGTYEYFHPAAHTGEAHFYMECSNKGICDRSTGLCSCFDGYEGNGCQRTVCPNKCSGHGTCESIRELGMKAGGSLIGKPLSRGAVTYDLWDANSTYGCYCDSWFHGPDCSKRSCKVGVDPLYLSAGTPRYETFVLHAYVPSSATLTTARLRLRLWDYHGESYLTGPISILTDATAGNIPINVEAVTNAIKEIPNLTFKSVTCENQGAGTKLAGFKSVRLASSKGMSIICQFSSNPGALRMPEVAEFSFDGVATADQHAFTVTTPQQGEDFDWFTVKSSFVVDTVSADGLTLTLTGGSPSPTTLIPALTLIKLGPHIVLAASSTATTVVLQYPLKNTLSASDKTIYLVDSANPITVTAGDAITVGMEVGDQIFTYDTTAPSLLVPGDLVFYMNQFFYVMDGMWEFTDAVPTTYYYLPIDKRFGGSTVDGTAGAATTVPHKVVLPADKSKFYRYVLECSGRGLCATDSGICSCFKGYTNDNCDTQNILAL